MKARTVLTGALVAAVAAATAAGIGGTTQVGPLFRWYAVAWALFAAAAWAVRGLPARHAAVLVLAGGALVAGSGLLAQPRTSDDAYRYVWDGRVQAAGMSPYDRTPADPALSRLRDDALFPPGGDCTGMWDAGDTCTRINRPFVHTVYPPVAEGYFLLVHALSPGVDGITAFQAAGWLLAMGTSVVLLRTRRPAWAALWAWCPAVALEAVNNAHVDALATLLTVAAFAIVARRAVAGGALLGAGIGAKLLPAVTIPGLLSGALRERRWRALLPVGVALAVLVAAYLPYVLLSRGSVLGYLGGYADEEGYEDGGGGRFALLRLLLPAAWEAPAVLFALTAAALLAVAAAVGLRGDPARPWRGALVFTATAFLLLTPGYAWYALLLIGLVALDGRWEWLAVAVASAVTYAPGEYAHVETAAYTLSAVVVVTGALVRGRYLTRAP
ncbi:glycosyltransferase 87 family protein [Phytomonospora sp. NPDC050363]|uniref:glycosyltransferase 87 family protein n=1 Tax=Phytomonospora sp. NPDC050363 TaxID=3155642 RepID=UPI0033DD6214